MIPECQTILDCAAATDDGGGVVITGTLKTCRSPVESPLQLIGALFLYRPDDLTVAQLTVSKC